MGIEKFKLPRRSYEELCNIIKAYWQLNKPSSLSEANQICGIGASNISANISFLVAVGILEGGRQKLATEIGLELGKALDHNKKDKIEETWQKIIKKNDFLSKMISALRIRKGMGTSDLESHIAYSSGESKASYVMTGARAVVDIFKASGVVQEKDDRIIPTEKSAMGGGERADEEKPLEDFGKPHDVLRDKGIDVSNMKKGPVSLNIQVRIDAKPTELKGLGKKLRDLMDSLKQGNNSKRSEK